MMPSTWLKQGKNRQVIPAVARVLESLGYSEQELKGMRKQMKLGDW